MENKKSPKYISTLTPILLYFLASIFIIYGVYVLFSGSSISLFGFHEQISGNSLNMYTILNAISMFLISLSIFMLGVVGQLTMTDPKTSNKKAVIK